LATLRIELVTGSAWKAKQEQRDLMDERTLHTTFGEVIMLRCFLSLARFDKLIIPFEILAGIHLAPSIFWWFGQSKRVLEPTAQQDRGFKENMGCVESRGW
jgi:hypothetical protein